MSTLDSDDKRLLIEAVKEGVVSGIGGSKAYDYAKPSGGSASGGSGDSSAIFGTGALNSLGKGAEKVGEGLGGLKGQLDQSVDGFQQLSRTGLSFNNNAIGMRDSIAQTRLSLDEYKQVMEKLSPSIAGLGGTVSQGAANFNKFSSQFMQTDFAEQLTKMGYTTRDLNDVMAANMANRRFTDLSDDMQRKKAIESTAELARQMDETSKLTGMSRQEQMADMKQRTENGKVQAAIQLEVMKGGKDAEQNYRDMNSRLQGMGKGVSDLADELFTGGVRTEEGAAKMAALGSAGVELEKAVSASKNAKTKEEKDAAELQMSRAKAAINERMKSEEFLQAVMTAGGRVGPAMQKMYEENKLKAGTTFTENKTGQTTGQAQATNAGAAVNQQQGRDEKGAKDEGAKTTELYIQTMNRSKDVTAMVASGANKMNDALVKIPETAKLIDGALAATKSRVKNDKGEEIPMAQGGIQGLLDRAAAAGLTDKKGTTTTGTTKDGKPVGGPLGNKENPLDTLKNTLTATIMNWAGAGPGTVDIVKFLGGDDLTAFTGGGSQGGRAEGSKASTGSWFEDFGTEKIMALHKKEAIVPEGKVGEFMQDMMKNANISNMTPKDASAKKTTMTMEEMDGMMQSMKSMSPDSLAQTILYGGQQAEMAERVYKELASAQKQVATEKKLEKPETNTTATPKDNPITELQKKLTEASTKTTATPKDNQITELQKKLVEAGAKINVDGKMGPETMSAIKANMASMVRETAKKPESSAPAAASADTGSKSSEKTTPATGDATLSDVVKSLESLNMLMGQLTAHAAETVEHGSNAVRATKGLNGNLFAR